MEYTLVSGDNHIDLTYCPQELWSAQAPSQWKDLVPHVKELDDGMHWFVEGKDMGMWNGVGPGFSKYTPGALGHIDEMKELGFEWDNSPHAEPRPTTPRLRIEDLDRDGLDAEIVYGCLRVNDLIPDGERRAWAYRTYNDWVASFAKEADPNRVFPLACIPNNNPQEAAAEVRRCAKMGLKGGDLPVMRMSVPLWHGEWDHVWQASAECQFPIAFHSTGEVCGNRTTLIWKKCALNGGCCVPLDGGSASELGQLGRLAGIPLCPRSTDPHVLDRLVRNTTTVPRSRFSMVAITGTAM